jgi:hypothetical protein
MSWMINLSQDLKKNLSPIEFEQFLSEFLSKIKSCEDRHRLKFNFIKYILEENLVLVKALPELDLTEKVERCIQMTKHYHALGWLIKSYTSLIKLEALQVCNKAITSLQSHITLRKSATDLDNELYDALMYSTTAAAFSMCRTSETHEFDVSMTLWFSAKARPNEPDFYNKCANKLLQLMESEEYEERV